MKILVTGHKGFIGQNLVYYFLGKGHKVDIICFVIIKLWSNKAFNNNSLSIKIVKLPERAGVVGRPTTTRL